VTLRSVLTYALIAFIVWWVIQQPANAAHLWDNIATLLTRIADGFANFVKSI
jgi:hypothetical protein